jgi:hypothetical protein
MTAIVVGTAAGIRSYGSHTVDVLDGADVTTLFARERTIWALVNHRELWRISDGKTDRVATLDGPRAWCVVASAGGLWIGTVEAHLFRLDGRQLTLVRSFENAPTRSEWYHPGGRAPGTWSLAAHGGRLYVNVHVGGILASNDGGETWAPTIDLHDDVHQVSVSDDGTVWAATGMRALAESRDAGRTWAYHGSGLHAPYLTCAVPTADGVLVAASSGHRATDGGVYRFDGETFRLCNGLPERFRGTVETRCLAARGRAAALAGLDGRLYASQDAGRTWNVVADNLPAVRAVVIG